MVAEAMVFQKPFSVENLASAFQDWADAKKRFLV